MRMGKPMGGMPPMPPGRRHDKHFNDTMPHKGFMPPNSSDDFYEKNFDMEQMEKECEQMLDIHNLTSKNCSFSQSNGGFINLSYDNTLYENVDIIRTFPFTEPDCYLSVRESLAKKREIGIIRNLNEDFDKNTIEIISNHLKLRYFMPVIEKIISIKEVAGYVHFNVRTNNGNLKFSLQTNANHILYLTDTRILITDLEGSRYEIPDTGKLTPKELKKLDLYL